MEENNADSKIKLEVKIDVEAKATPKVKDAGILQKQDVILGVQSVAILSLPMLYLVVTPLQWYLVLGKTR